MAPERGVKETTVHNMYLYPGEPFPTQTAHYNIYTKLHSEQ